jgi:hypothetical protein
MQKWTHTVFSLTAVALMAVAVFSSVPAQASGAVGAVATAVVAGAGAQAAATAADDGN